MLQTPTVKRRAVITILILGILALAVPITEPVRAAGTPRFETTACWVDAPSGYVEGKNLDCGYMIVPEDRTVQNDKTIKVAVMRLKAPKSTGDPIVFLQGGPGGPAIKDFGPLVGPAWVNMFERDFIVIDQRGVGLSEPSLMCQEYTDLNYEMLNKKLTPEETVKLTVQAFATCRDKLVKAGVNLNAFTNIQNAADVADLAAALGYDKLNVYGVSYGTTLALTVIREHADVLRSVVLDSVAPPQWDGIEGPIEEMPDTFNRLFAECAASAECDAAYPKLDQIFATTVKALNDKPATLKIAHPTSGKEYDVLVTGDVFASQIFNAMYVTQFIPSLPQMIGDASKGKYDRLKQLMDQTLFQFEDINWPMYYSVECSSEFPFTTTAAIKAATDKLPDSLKGFVGQDSTIPLCTMWKVNASPASENTPVVSDVPTLVVSGALDPITPPTLGALAAKTLKNGYFFTFKGYGQGVIPFGGNCPQSIMQAFVGDPATKPDGSCVDSLPGVVFEVPATKIELEPFSSTTMKVSGQKPKGWTQMSEGIFSLGQNVLLLQAAPQKLDAVLKLLTQQLKLDAAPDVKDTRTAGKLTWKLYEFQTQGVSINMALAESGSRTLIVLLQTSPADRDTYYESVFLPAVDALKPTN